MHKTTLLGMLLAGFIGLVGAQNAWAVEPPAPAAETAKPAPAKAKTKAKKHSKKLDYSPAATAPAITAPAAAAPSTGLVADAPATKTTTNWNGFYVGANLGGSWGKGRTTDLNGYNSGTGGRYVRFDTVGFTGGLQLGYNWQPEALRWNPTYLSGHPLALLLGVESDVGYLGNNGTGTVPPTVAGGDTKSRALSDLYVTARARAGLVLENDYLVYATAGYMGLHTRSGVRDNCTGGACGGGLVDAKTRSFRSGWTAGGGLEAALCDRWTVKGEYLHYDLGTNRASSKTSSSFPFNVAHDGNILRLGANYKFDLGF